MTTESETLQRTTMYRKHCVWGGQKSQVGGLRGGGLEEVGSLRGVGSSGGLGVFRGWDLGV